MSLHVLDTDTLSLLQERHAAVLARVALSRRSKRPRAHRKTRRQLSDVPAALLPLSGGHFGKGRNGDAGAPSACSMPLASIRSASDLRVGNVAGVRHPVRITPAPAPNALACGSERELLQARRRR